MESPHPLRRPRRLRYALIPALAVLLWYGTKSGAYVANLRAFSLPPGASSMAPTLQPGDRVVVDTRGGFPARGEIWTFNSPAGATLIKRVIGLPGESVEVAGGRVLIDGKPLDEPYLSAPMNYAMPPVRLKADEYFVLGDSRNASFDSHLWGPLARSRLIGRAEHRIWPRTRIGSLLKP